MAAPIATSATRDHGERFLVFRVAISLSRASITRSLVLRFSFFAASANLRASVSARWASFSSVSNSFARFSVSIRERKEAFSASSASIKSLDARSSSAAALHADNNFSLFAIGCSLTRVTEVGELSTDLVCGCGG